MIILVTGGRDYADQANVFKVLDRIHPDLVIEGGARGADEQARHWCAARGVPNATFHAPWAYHGKSAGALRNRWMIKFIVPELVVAFPGGAGTAHMVACAEREGLHVMRIES